MNQGFGNSGKAKVTIYQDEIDKLLKKYKGIKKYMKSSLYEIRTIDKNEEIVSKLVQEYEQDPM